MKKSGIILIAMIVALACSCSKKNTMIEIARGVTVTVPQDHEKIKKDSTDLMSHWETSFEDDRFSIFRYLIPASDSLLPEDQKHIFRKNVDAFLSAFILKNIDSTYLYSEGQSQCNISFDFVQNGEDYRLYNRFVVTGDSFIAFCFQTPFPVDVFSKKMKDKIFKSIEIK